MSSFDAKNLMFVSDALCDHLIQQAVSEKVERIVVGAIIIEQDTVFIMRRADDEFMGGLLEFPGGGVDDGETLLEALYREVHEETGLEVIDVKEYLDCFDYQSQSGKKTRQFNFIVKAAGVPQLSAEHQSFQWTTIKAASCIQELNEVFRNSLLTLVGR